MKSYKTKQNEIINFLQDSDIETGDGYVKFSNGILICYGRVTADADKASGYFTFPVSFVSIPITIAVHNWSNVSRGNVTVGHKDNEKVEILIYDNESNISQLRHADLVSIGRWK